MRKLILAALALVLPDSAFAQPSDPSSMLSRAAPAVVQILGSGCSGEGRERAGSGFAWEKPGRVVTALHVVTGCTSVTVRYQGIGERTATVERTLVARDLVLLEVQDAPDLQPLAITADVPPVNAQVWVYGYGGGRATREDRLLRVTDANRETPLLSQAVDDSARRELQTLRSPLLDTEVLRVEGNLVPGDSGAPVLDSSGQVVAVGSGGLQRGTIGAGWAVRARYVAELATSEENAEGPAAGSAGVLYALVNPGIGAEATCGGITFHRTRNIQLGDLVKTTDDPLGLMQLAAGLGQPQESIATLRFDIWTDAASGGAVAVPEGAALSPDGDRCRAPLGDGVVDLQLSGTEFASGQAPAALLQQVSEVSLAFERRWNEEFEPYTTMVPGFTYPAARPASDGIIRRLAWNGQRPGQLPHYVFETVMADSQSFIGIAAVNRAYNPWGPQPPSVIGDWTAATFAVFLSTLPP